MSVEKDQQELLELTLAEVDTMEADPEEPGIHMLVPTKPLAMTDPEVDHPPFRKTLAAWRHIISL
jgi:hypothetical protein